jgi:hypothetical protein
MKQVDSDWKAVNGTILKKCYDHVQRMYRELQMKSFTVDQPETTDVW